MKRTLICLLFSLFLITNVLSQSVVGTWKRTAMLLTEANGNTDDSMPDMTKAMPCTARITYTFLADGTMSTNVPDDCGVIKKATDKINKTSRWAVSGNKLKVWVLDKSLPDSEQVLTFSGNTMTWTFDYAANPQMPNPTKAKRLVINYVRL
ncbi:lipocalin-like domain-containing protein [Fibrella aquatilis]|uniref:Lipocalin family protein n=1 Tax=Fibrella aquatilis TaxID=2817059 RepID=A0A939G3R9_9BACT|nr:lipocalin family protein [Fibrella aquatilis]MBO0931336.1 lipocalin family protein [Fibrella aquatilis]